MYLRLDERGTSIFGWIRDQIIRLLTGILSLRCLYKLSRNSRGIARSPKKDCGRRNSN
jgi:hypothetical protein